MGEGEVSDEDEGDVGLRVIMDVLIISGSVQMPSKLLAQNFLKLVLSTLVHFDSNKKFH